MTENKLSMEPKELIQRALTIALDKKGENMRVLDVASNLTITDYFVLISVTNRRQAQAVCSTIDIEMKHLRVPKARIEGQREGWWILMDYDMVVIHIFQTEARDYYDLDQLWADATDLSQSFVITDRSPDDEAPAGS